MSGSSSTRDLIGVELSASSLPDVSQDYYLAPGPHSDNEKAKRLLMGLSLLCAIFIVIEIIGGYIANSVAVMTDACHMFSDLMSIFVSLFAIRISRQPANPRFTSGFYRAEVLGAMLSLTILWVLTFFLVFLAARKIMDGKLEVDANSMIILALIGCFFNLVMFAATRQSTSSTHTHWHSHSISANMNIRAAVTHIIGDLVQSIGVLVAAIIIKIFGWTIADPICTFIFSIIVIVTTFELTCDIVMILMEGTPKHLNYEDMHNDLKDITGVRQVHDLRIWSLSMTEFAVVAHLVIDESIAANSTTQQAVGLLRSKYNVHFVTIQIEVFDGISICSFCKSL